MITDAFDVIGSIFRSFVTFLGNCQFGDFTLLTIIALPVLAGSVLIGIKLYMR